MSKYNNPLDTRIAELEAALETHRNTAFGAVCAERDTLRARVAELEAAHPSVVDTAKIIALREERDQLRARVEELEEEEEFQAAANARLREDLAKTQSDIDAAFAEGRFAEINTRVERIKELEEFANEREAARIKAQLQWVDMRAECDQLKQQVSDITSMWTEACESVQQIRADYKVLQNANLFLAAQRDDARAELAAVTTELDVERRTHRETEAELEALRPKPVVEVFYLKTQVWQDQEGENFAHVTHGRKVISNLTPNVILTFTDDVLTSAEVIK